MTRAVFLDRDGTIIADPGYLATVDGMELLPGAGPALRSLLDAGFLLVLVTNQSGIARGYFTAAMVDAQHAELCRRLAPLGVTFAGIEVCPHHPDAGCACRKPRPGMLLTAAARLEVDLMTSFVVGDKTSDVAAGRAVGCRTVLIGAGLCPEADCVVPDLPGAAAWIRAQTRHREV